MSAVRLVSTTEYHFEKITTMLNIQDLIVLAVKEPENIFRRIFTSSFSIYVTRPNMGSWKLFENYKNIPDMTAVGLGRFAFIDQGSWVKSNIHLVNPEVKDKQAFWTEEKSFTTDTNCCGISFTDNHYFLSYSGSFRKNGYVKMLDMHGTEKTVFSIDDQENTLFSKTLSKIYVSPDFRLYVSDIGKNQLSIVRVTSIGLRVSLDVEYDYMAASSIIPKGNGELFIAVDGHKNEVVLLSKEGPKKVIPKYEMSGTPTALCLVGDVLFVASSEGWLKKCTRIISYKDKENRRKEERLISL